jgi:hypothetical protein
MMNDRVYGNCEYCGDYTDLRPYGIDRKMICFSCAMDPKNKATTEKMFFESEE